MQSQLDYAFRESPGQCAPAAPAHQFRLQLSFVHLGVLSGSQHFAPHYTACLTPYISSISSFIRAAITSRFSFPFTVNMPLCEAVYQVLYERLPVMEVVRGLMSRPIKAETE